ncbi:MAG: MFS transporter, partial [Psychrosphaera sp.]|nr:MFS transporter [Psychrosphaera sp.]
SMGFDLNTDLSGFDALLEEYRLKNPDISHIYLLHNNKPVNSSIHEEYQMDAVIDDCMPQQGGAASSIFITSCLSLASSNYQILVRTPWSRVYARLWRAARNIVVLFIASALLSNMFLNVLLSLQQSWKKTDDVQTGEKTEPLLSPLDLQHRLQLVRPVFAMGVLMEAINLSFLPAYFFTHFANSDFSVSTVFGVYFVAFAFTLIPAGHWAEKHSLRNMMLFGLALSAIGIGGIGFTHDPVNIILLRALGGIGQGTLFIAVQSYLLLLESKQKGLRGTEQLVIGFNMSTISGATIGALLMPMLGEQAVFMCGTFIGLACIGYCLALITDVAREPV